MILPSAGVSAFRPLVSERYRDITSIESGSRRFHVSNAVVGAILKEV